MRYDKRGPPSSVLLVHSSKSNLKQTIKGNYFQCKKSVAWVNLKHEIE